jgi:hypothetical protein
MLKNEIYKIGGNLGLDKNDIDIILNSSQNVSNIHPSSNVYKSGTYYDTISPNEIYKHGGRYGTLSINEIYKAGTQYGTVSPNDF